MRPSLRFAVALSLMMFPASIGCSPSIHVHAVVNPSASFDRYRSFSFGRTEGAPAGYLMTPRAADVERRLEPLIADTLEQKGYLPASGRRGDIFILFGAGQRDTSIHEESSMGADWQPDDENADFVEGSLVVDVFDEATGKKIWHGASRADINNPDRINEPRLTRTVQQLLASFPAASTGAPPK